jgi:hypothetical protein
MSRIVVVGLVVAALGVGVFAAVRLMGGDDDEQQAVEAEAEAVTLSGALSVSSRERLSICVDGAGARDVSAGEVDAVREALDGVLAGAPEHPKAYDNPAVTLGCPEARALTGDPVGEGFERSQLAHYLDAVEQASTHRAFVYFAGEDDFGAAFLDEPYGITTEEAICQGDQCFGLTLGIYVQGTDVLSQALDDALNLQPPTPEPTTDWRACALGTPEWWCYRYEDFLHENPGFEQSLTPAP